MKLIYHIILDSMNEQKELNPKLVFESSEGRKLPILKLNGSADILPQVGNLLNSFNDRWVERFKLPWEVLSPVIIGGPEYPEDDLVLALYNGGMQKNQKGVDVAVSAVLTKGKIIRFAKIDTRSSELPFKTLYAICDYPIEK
jgi:hypothetical protein